MYNCRKRQYYATAVQFTEANEAEVLALLNNKTTYASMYIVRDELRQIMVRFSKPAPGQRMIDTLDAGSWVVTGENGAVKCYTDEQFKIKYEEVHHGSDKGECC